MGTDAPAVPHGSLTARRIVIALAVCAVLGFGGMSIHVLQGYPAFVARRTTALAEAEASSSAAIIDYARQHFVITVHLYNPTGGTVAFYVGTAGAKQEAAQGVEVNQPPELVDTIAPHGRDSIYVRQWATKYISYLTNYIFLGTVRGPAVNFFDMSFHQSGSEYTTSVTALPNNSDSNFGMIPQPLEGQGSVMTANQVNADELSDVHAFVEAHRVKAELYATDFGSYLGTIGTQNEP